MLRIKWRGETEKKFKKKDKSESCSKEYFTIRWTGQYTQAIMLRSPFFRKVSSENECMFVTDLTDTQVFQKSTHKKNPLYNA